MNEDKQLKFSQPSKKTITTNNKTFIIIGLLLLVGIGSFFGGAQYQKSHGTKLAANPNGSATNAQRGGFGGPGSRRSGSIGAVTAISATSVSLSDQRSGTTKTYAITSTTTVTNNDASASVSDIMVGDTVLVSASATATTTATRIAINPTMNNGFGGQSQTDSSGSSDTTGSSSLTN